MSGGGGDGSRDIAPGHGGGIWLPRSGGGHARGGDGGHARVPGGGASTDGMDGNLPHVAAT